MDLHKIFGLHYAADAIPGATSDSLRLAEWSAEGERLMKIGT